MAGDGHSREVQHVLVVGGGIAGVETVLALADLGDERLAVTLCDPRREFVFRPFAVGEPYGAARVFRYDLPNLAARAGAEFRGEGIVAVETARRTAVTRDGDRLPYDYLVITGGVRMLWAVAGAVTFWGVADEGQVGEVVGRLRAGELRRLVFTMPGGRSWALPLYELALLGATQLETAGSERTKITVVTPEDAPLELFGLRAAEQMGALLSERGIGLVTGTHPVRFDNGRLRVAPGEEIEADAVVSLPRLEGRRFGGIPHDADGFVGVDEHGRVIGLDRVFAAGDVTSFPIKQGGIATQQADAVAEAIAADAGAPVDPQPFDPVMRGVLWTGHEPRYLYGRPTGGHGDPSRLSSEPDESAPGDKVAGRYFSPFVAALVEEAEDDPPDRRRRRLPLTHSA
ncbi:MAG: NAD(P)/FAD-dependent oxidoreductase [Chloroflexota bacterium]